MTFPLRAQAPVICFIMIIIRYVLTANQILLQRQLNMPHRQIPPAEADRLSAAEEKQNAERDKAMKII